MEIPNWLRAVAVKAAQGIKLVPSEKEELEARKKAEMQKRSDVYDRKSGLEDTVRRLENQLLKLDQKRQSEHGILKRGTEREMQAVGVKLKDTEKLLHQAIDAIADLDQRSAMLERLLQGQAVTAEDWDEIGVDLEELEATRSEASKARAQVQGIEQAEMRDLSGEVNLDELLGEIRGPAQQADATTEDMVKQLKACRAAEPET